MLRRIVVKTMMFNSDNQLLLVRRSRTAPRRALEWDSPGGFVEDGESYVLAGARETAEETGIALDPTAFRLAFAESRIWAPADQQENTDVTNLYFVAATSKTEVTLSHEHDQFVWVTLAEAQKMITYDTQLHALEYINKVGH